jgi:predicted DNA-binding ribbon-helix-helix protein
VSRKRAESPVRKRSAKIGGHQTSISVEDEFWAGLKEIAHERKLPLHNLITDIHANRQHANLSSVIRLFVLDHYVRLADAQKRLPRTTEAPAGSKAKR